MANADKTNRRPRQRLPDREVVDAGQSEREADVELLEARDDALRAGLTVADAVSLIGLLDDVVLGAQRRCVEALDAQRRDVDERRASQHHVPQYLTDGGTLQEPVA